MEAVSEIMDILLHMHRRLEDVGVEFLRIVQRERYGKLAVSLKQGRVGQKTLFLAGECEVRYDRATQCPSMVVPLLWMPRSHCGFIIGRDGFPIDVREVLGNESEEIIIPI
jgi:hypothetical protein